MRLPTIGFLGIPISDKHVWMSCPLTTGMQTDTLGKKDTVSRIEQSRVNLLLQACHLRDTRKNHASPPGKSWNENGGRKKWSERWRQLRCEYAWGYPGLCWFDGESHPQNKFDSLQWAFRMNRFHADSKRNKGFHCGCDIQFLCVFSPNDPLWLLVYHFTTLKVPETCDDHHLRSTKGVPLTDC